MLPRPYQTPTEFYQKDPLEHQLNVWLATLVVTAKSDATDNTLYVGGVQSWDTTVSTPALPSSLFPN